MVRILDSGTVWLGKWYRWNYLIKNKESLNSNNNNNINSPPRGRGSGRRAARVVDDAAAAGASRVAGRWIAGGLTDATASRPSGPLRIRGGAARRPSHANSVADERVRARSTDSGTRIQLTVAVTAADLMTVRPTDDRRPDQTNQPRSTVGRLVGRSVGRSETHG